MHVPCPSCKRDLTDADIWIEGGLTADHSASKHDCLDVMIKCEHCCMVLNTFIDVPTLVNPETI